MPALTAALDDLLGNEDERLRLARGGREKVAREFDREVNIGILAALFGGDSASNVAERRGAS